MGICCGMCVGDVSEWSGVGVFRDGWFGPTYGVEKKVCEYVEEDKTNEDN